MTPKQRLLAACAAGILIAAYWLAFSTTSRGSTYVRFDRNQGDRSPIVVRAGSNAEAAGLRTGDIVTLRGLTPEQRWDYQGAVPIGTTVVYRVVRGERTQDVAVVAQPRLLPPLSWNDLGFAARIWMIAFAVLLAVRAGDQRRARYLAYAMLGWSVGNMLWQQNFWVPSLALRVGADFVDKITDAANVILIALFAQTYGPSGRLRQALTRTTIALALVNFAIFMYASLTLLSGIAGTVFDVKSIVFCAAELATLACLAAAIVRAAVERSALVWAAVPLSLIYLSQFAYLVSLIAFGGRGDVSVVTNIGFLFTPVGLTYSVFSRRVVDVGFVLNRTIVYSALTTIIVGTFATAEWAAAKWLGEATRAQSAGLDAALAIALALSFRPLHARVEKVVDVLFFRRRYDDERALREFAEEAPYITDPAVAIERAETMLRRHTDATTVAVLVAREDGTIAGVDENDPALVRMRARRTTVDLHATHSALPGALGVPLIAHGRLLGLISLGARSSGDHVTPDERRTFTDVANGLALALAARPFEAAFSASALRAAIEPALRTVRDELRADLLDVLALRERS